jgi:predicted Zn-dependent protease
VKGGWGFVSFNDLTGLQDKVEMAVKQARFIGKGNQPVLCVQPCCRRRSGKN